LNPLKINLFVLGLMIVTLNLCWSQNPSSTTKVKEIIQYLDELYRSNSSYAVMEMMIVTPHWERTLKMKIWTEGRDKTFIRITEPKKEQGMATLRIKNEMWNYLPKTNKVIKIPPSMMMSSWMGSDFNNDDLVNEFSLMEDYHYKIIQPDTAREGHIYISCIPRENLPIVWKEIVMEVHAQDYLPIKESYFDEKGQLMRVINYKDVKVMDYRKIPSVMELIPQGEEGKKTVLKYLEVKFNIDLDKDIFSLRNLRTAM
jgi:outer membrane lipoprotein-sorting protein